MVDFGRFSDLKMVGSPPPGGVERSYGTWSIPEYTFLHFGTGFTALQCAWETINQKLTFFFA